MQSTTITLRSTTRPVWAVDCVAKIDTGAARTSIDSKLAEFLRADLAGTVRTKNAMGSQLRPVVWINFIWNEEEYRIKASVVDREGLKAAVILGQDVLA
jgi:hypothetical protein